MTTYRRRKKNDCQECGDELRPAEAHLCGPCAQMLLEAERYDVPWELYEEEDYVETR